MIGSVGALLLAAQPGPATRVLIVTGLSGAPEYATSLARQGAALVQAAKERWNVADSNLIYLAETQPAGPGPVTGRATREAVIEALGSLGSRAGPDDVILIVLAGHGSEQGEVPKLNLPGPDLTATDLSRVLVPLATQTVVIVNTASASGGFLKGLSGPRRIVITATKTGFERNATMFGEFFVRGLTSEPADADKNGRVSIAEAFEFARQEVARAYRSASRLQTEHAQLEDPGGLAQAVAFPLAKEVLADDPRAAPLLAERRRLESAVAALRNRKALMDSTQYGRELEALLVKLAETNLAIRALRGKTP